MKRHISTTSEELSFFWVTNEIGGKDFFSTTASNMESKKGLFTIEERVELIKESTAHLENVEVVSFNGLLVDLAKQYNARVILKGLRAVSDFEYELQMALMNSKLDPDIETLFMMTSIEYSYLSSSSVKQVGKFGGDISGLVPREIVDVVKTRLK